MQLHIERLHAAQHREPDAARSDSADIHAFDVVRALDAVRNVPAALYDPVVRRDVISHERQDHHHDVLGHADAVAIRHFRNGDAAVHGRLQVRVVGADAGSDDKLELRRLCDQVRGCVRGPEWLGNQHFGLDDLPGQAAVRAVLVRGHYELVSTRLEELAQAELAGDAAEQSAGPEVDPLWRRQGLAAGIVGEFRQVVTRILLRITLYRVVVQHTHYFPHLIARLEYRRHLPRRRIDHRL